MSGVVAEILEQSLGKIVIVRLKAGKILRGKLKGFDKNLPSASPQNLFVG
jgi:small nuclear ribonucleoprotein (snRNP)-like protein